DAGLYAILGRHPADDGLYGQVVHLLCHSQRWSNRAGGRAGAGKRHLDLLLSESGLDDVLPGAGRDRDEAARQRAPRRGHLPDCDRSGLDASWNYPDSGRWPDRSGDETLATVARFSSNFSTARAVMQAVAALFASRLSACFSERFWQEFGIWP